MNRIKELDLLKTFILVFTLAGIHSCYDLSTLGAPNPLFNVLNVLGGTFTAPTFMFCMGIALGFSRHQSPKDWLRRGVQLITIGMALNVLRWGTLAFRAFVTNEPELYKGLAQIFNVDIMQFAGLAFMLLALLQYLHVNHWGILIIGVVLNLIGSLLEGHCTDSYVVNQVLGYFYPTPTCCCFPLLNWFIFVAAGNTMGYFYRLMKDIGRLFRVVIPLGGAITAVYMYLTIVVELPCLRTLQGDWGFYWMNPYDALPTAFGVAPFMLSVFWLLGKIVPDSWMNVLGYPAKYINQFYCISWVWIMWTANVFLFVPKATTTGTFIVAWVSMVVLTLLTMIIYNRYLKTRIEPLFEHHAVAWTIGIWVAIIAFGVWYFNTIPGPYIMPY